MAKEDMIKRCIGWISIESAGNDAGHDILHLQRVVNNSLIIAGGEGYNNRELIILCALFHDSADHKFTTDQNAALRRVESYLAGEGVPSPEIASVLHVASNISFSGRSDKIVKTPELEIVMDADRLDAIGAVGIARAFTYGGFRGRRLYGDSKEGTTIGHFGEKLLLLKDMMNTATAKKMAQVRHEFMIEFLKQFERETGIEPATLSLGS